MARTLRMLVRGDLHRIKGIPFSRQHIARLIDEGKFPPPDGKTADSPKAPNFWFEHTIDAYLRSRAAGTQRRPAHERNPVIGRS